MNMLNINKCKKDIENKQSEEDFTGKKELLKKIPRNIPRNIPAGPAFIPAGPAIVFNAR